MASNTAFRKVIITGGAGTCGEQIIKELLLDGKAENIVSLDNNEGALFFQQEQFKNSKQFSCDMADITDLMSLNRAFRGADLVIHCAAFKNVPMSEISPSSCVNVNVKGTENVIEAAINNGVSTVVFTSSDKAVNPTNIMGATKLVGERLITSANLAHSGTKFASVRFGNVIGSTGSVLPVFVKQIMNGSPMTVTDPDMTRFMMGQRDAAKLVLKAAQQAIGGEIFITKMPVIQIRKFAEALYKIASDQGIVDMDFNYERDVKISGIRPGEKLYEELLVGADAAHQAGASASEHH